MMCLRVGRSFPILYIYRILQSCAAFRTKNYHVHSLPQIFSTPRPYLFRSSNYFEIDLGLILVRGVRIGNFHIVFFFFLRGVG